MAAGQRGDHGECVSCHSTEGAGSREFRQAFARCRDCHPPAPRPAGTTDRLVAGHVAIAEEAASGAESCSTCHAPHSGTSPGMLRTRDDGTQRFDGDPDAGSRLCLSCHAQHGRWRGGGAGAYARHPIGIPVPADSMVSGAVVRLPLADVHGTEDPLDDVIACTTCHDVHDSRNADLLRWPQGESKAWCTACHRIGGSLRGDELLAWERLRKSSEEGARDGEGQPVARRRDFTSR